MDQTTAGRLRWPLRALGVLLMLLLVGAAGSAWYASNQLVASMHPSGGDGSDTVLHVSTSPSGVTVVSFANTPEAARPGRWGMGCPGGSGMVGPVLAQTPQRVDRVLLSGAHPTDGCKTGFGWTYRGDPKTALGLPFTELSVPTELGPAPAWYIPADPAPGPATAPGTIAITVHGSNADRNQPLQYAAAIHRGGLPILDITYRNDVGAPRSPDGLLHIGQSEWRDLEAAVRTATSLGAQHVVLYGGSMGGAIILRFLAQSGLAERVSAVMLDAPELSVPRTMAWAGSQRHIPGPLVELAVRLSGWRVGFDVRQIDALRYPPAVRPPTLILQGAIDQNHPAAAARELAANGPTLRWPIQYAEFPGADHSSSWNIDPVRYETIVDEFLAQHARPGPAPAG